VTGVQTCALPISALEERANRYLPALRLLLRWAVGLIAALALLETWGVDALGWLDTPLGKQLTESAFSIMAVLVLAFDAERVIGQIRHLVPAGADIVSLDAGRLDDSMLTNAKHYLDPINFATNFAFFRDAGGHHTRLVTVNYWGGYGAVNAKLWLCLLGADGATIAKWTASICC